ncbi:hypothetical protein BASA50_004983 [Batrachochytrium salamandrivorans]|uniref:PPPDE domain-containing protein n=1 Tax=Batrachochytrium salamandrivorans TaxID=1357716 RepID=A0ABQ8FE24_9FUNG|nr:hypothetical protein BASA60_003248 [Batrachochytrium salamandrivorans]KAH6594858.1 hypothetical protein BASA61_003948 [Batrachochytrium salamandrivorans]KAH6596652.1 hypothetical protein BASA50_004983 [Batrachochytrium salamandrivorans]KAH9270449.1 hypothetical protein BASA83_007449 [Batrachochytrium salamandrivorans]KAJ1344099.1 hypothetical protein BSLG_001239 [Batrachochytrium salamandrivorans]
MVHQHNVQLLVYDLSNGMAKALSMGLTGRQIDGIWHTSVVVFNKEYCFGQGIEVFSPGTAPHGTPCDTITMGTTHIPLDVFEEYIDNMRAVWTAEKYHLLDNNCNSFSDELCQFLVGKHIPPHITGLPAEFLETPFGQSLLPMIQNLYGPSAFQANTSTQSSNRASAASAAIPVDHPGSHVHPCTSIMVLNSLLASHRCIAIDFTSENCGPCRVISPEFDRLITEANETFRPLGVPALPKIPILGLSVEIGRARELAAAYNVTATPTFMFFLDGKPFHEFRGANVPELKQSINFLLYTAFPAHPHASLDLHSLTELCQGPPIQFSQSSKLDAIFSKLQAFAVDHQLEWDETASKALAAWMGQGSDRPELKKVEGWQPFLSHLLVGLPLDKVFPALDIARQLVMLDPASSAFFLGTDASHSLVTLMAKIAQESKTTPVTAMPSRIMLLRLGCNLFSKSDPTMPLASLSQPRGMTDARELFTQVVVDHLLMPVAQLQEGAVMLMYNVAWSITSLRTSGDSHSGRSNADVAALIDEGWICELVAALCSAIQSQADACCSAAAADSSSIRADGHSNSSSSSNTVLHLVSALGFCLVYATPLVIELAQVVGVLDSITVLSSACSERIQAKTSTATTTTADADADADSHAALAKGKARAESTLRVLNEVRSLLAGK